ncbi:MAG TPA: lactate utilization protein [bacterium]
MNSAANAQFHLFKDRYEKLAGQVYFASNQLQAVKAVSAITLESKITRVVLTPLFAGLDDRLSKHFTRSRLPVVALDNTGAMPVPHQINEADLGITAAEFGIAETGTIVEVTTDDAHRLISSLPRVHIAFLKASQIIDSINDAAPLLRSVYRRHHRHCNITFISGPSRTADIEMKLFLGVHGPQESHVIVCDF